VSSEYYQGLLASRIVTAECPPKNKKETTYQWLAKNLAVVSIFKYYVEKPRFSRRDEDYFNIGGFYVKKKMVLEHNEKSDLSLDQVKSNYEASQTILNSIHADLKKKE